MSEFPRVSGKVEKVYINATREGKPYQVVVLDNGDRFSNWRKGDFNKVIEGTELFFDYSSKGKWNNIERIYTEVDDLTENSGNGNGTGPDTGTVVDAKYNGHMPGNGNGGGNGNGNGYEAEKLDRMVRMSCVKSASNLFTGSKIPFDERADKVIEMARKFKDYILADDDFGLEPAEPLDPAG